MERRVEVTCQFCSKQFLKCVSQIKKTNGKNFCSKVCSAKRRLGKAHNPPKQRTCLSCECSFICSAIHHSRTYCPKCAYGDRSHLVYHYESNNNHKRRKVFQGVRVDYRKMTLAEATNIRYVKNRHRAYLFSLVRSLGRQWNRTLLSLPCAKCGYERHVQLSHIKPIASFSGETTLGEINDPANVVQLCPNCHWEFDHGFLLIEEIWSAGPESNGDLKSS